MIDPVGETTHGAVRAKVNEIATAVNALPEGTSVASIVWRVEAPANVQSSGGTTVVVPNAGLSVEPVLTEVVWLTAGSVTLSVYPLTGPPALDSVSAGGHVELSVSTLDGASSLAAYITEQPITATDGTAQQQIVFDGSYSPHGDSTGLAFDAESNAIVVSVAAMYVVRAVLHTVNTAA